MRKTLAALSALASALALSLAAAPPASADVLWTVTGQFDDGGLLSGWFDYTQYGFLADWSVTTTAGSSQPGFTYTPQTTFPAASGPTFYDVEPDYFGALHLTFTGDLTVATANNPLVGGIGGPSYECVSSFSCVFGPVDGHSRFITSGFASAATGAPEPAAWALMIGGFGLAGAALRRRAARAI